MNNNVKDFFNSIADKWNNDDNNFDVINYLFSLIDIKKNEDVIDLGCGKGVITPIIYKYTNKQVLGIDLSNKMIDYAKKINSDINKYKYVCADFMDYNFNQKFNKIIIFNAYPHFLDKEALASKCFDTLKDGGILVIMHDLGKDKLNSFHHEHANKISNGLLAPNEEYLSFKDKFILDKYLDENDKYLMILRKI